VIFLLHDLEDGISIGNFCWNDGDKDCSGSVNQVNDSLGDNLMSCEDAYQSEVYSSPGKAYRDLDRQKNLSPLICVLLLTWSWGLIISQVNVFSSM